MDRKMFRENDRLIGSNEAEEAKSSRRQLLACFLGNILKLSYLYIILAYK